MFLETKEELEAFLLQDNIQEEMIAHEQEIGERFPDMKKCIGFPQNNMHHHLDVFRHTALALSFCSKSVDLRLALFLHDIGKPTCFQDEKNGIRHFKGHPIASTQIAKKILTELGYDDKYIKKILLYVRNHDDVITKANIKWKINTLGYKKVGQLLKMQECDAKAHHPLKVEKRLLHLAEIKILYQQM